MSQVLKAEFYTFAPSAKTITFAGVPALTLDRILGVYNLTRDGVQIYDPFDPLTKGSLLGAVLTLVYDTTAHAAGDALMVLVSNEALDGLTRTYTITATGNQVGVPTAGYGSVLVELTGTFSATVTLQGSSDSTDGANGTWTTLYGFVAEDVPISSPSTSINSSIRRRIYRAVDAAWIRINTNYTSGSVIASIARRVAAIGERAIAVANTPTVTLGSANNNIGSLGTTSSSTGALSLSSRIVSSAGTVNATLAKSNAGRVYKITGYNAVGSVRWLRFFNKSSVPTPGTDTAFFAIPLPPGAFSFDMADIGHFFSTGIAYAITAGPADNDAAAIAAGDILNLNVWYA